MYKIYRVTTSSGSYSEFTEIAFAEKELQNLVSNGKQGIITEITRFI